MEYILFISKTTNNIFCNVININGKLIRYVSFGLINFKGSAKKTIYALEQLGLNLSIILKQRNIFYLDYFVLTTKLDRKVRNILKGLYKGNIKIKNFYVMPKVAHNGLRKKKKKRH